MAVLQTVAATVAAGEAPPAYRRCWLFAVSVNALPADRLTGENPLRLLNCILLPNM